MNRDGEKNVAEFQAEAAREVSRFIRAINKISEMGAVKAATEHTPAKVTGSRNFTQIAMDDALSAFEDMVVDIRRQVPDVKESLIPVGIYQQLMNARYSGEKRITPEEAKTALNSAVQEKLSSPIIKEPGTPAFYNVLADRAPEGVTEDVISMWVELVTNMSQLFRNEEAIIADKTAFALQVTLSDQFNEDSMGGLDDLRIDIADMQDGMPSQEAAVTSAASGNSSSNLPVPVKFSPQLDKLLQMVSGINLTDKAVKKQLPTIFGRVPDMQNIIEVLLQKEAPHALLHGEEGVGMTATVQGLAQRIASGDVPQKLKDSAVVSISMATLIHEGGQGPHEVLRMILNEAAKHNQSSDKKIILHIEDMGTDAEQSSQIIKQLAPIMRSVLAHTVRKNSADLSIIFEMPEQHLDVMKSTDPLVLKTFTPVELKPLPKADVMDFLNHNAPKLAAHHGIALSDDNIEYLYKKTDKFMPNRHHPAKDIAVLGSVLATAEATGGKTIVDDNFDTVIAKLASLPKTFVGSDISDRIENLKENLGKRVFGQDPAVTQIADTIALVNDGLHDPKKPIGCFYLLGPTGVGKTEIARSLGAILFDDEDAIIRVDLSEFHEKHTVSRIVGSPPGYVGYGEKGPLDDVKKRPFSVILFDEAEKAHPEVDNALMRILDEGILIKMDGTRLDFRNCVVIMTSNLGAQAAERAAEQTPLGFVDDSVQEQEKNVDVTKARMTVVKERLKPEFRGRVTMINLDYLTEEAGKKIVLKKVNEVSERLRDNKRYKDITIKIAPAAVQGIMAIGYNRLTGARPLAEAVKEHIQIPLRHWLKENADSITGRSATLTIESVRDKKGEGEFRVSKQFPPTPAVIPPRAASGPT